MTCLTKSRREELEAQLASKQKQLTAANAALEKILSGDRGHVQKYTFDSGEGRQSVTHTDPQKLLLIISTLEKEIEFINKKLNGTGLVAVKFRRNR